VRFGLLLGGVLLVAATTGIASAESLCGPFDEAYSLAAAEPLAADPGITTGSDGGDRPRSPGRIVELADAAEDGASSDPRPAEGADDATGSEAILALPKDETGALPTDFELGPGARIRQSFFSPVVCATIARVTGPAGAALDELVTVVPDTATVVPNDVYRSAAAELRPAPLEAALAEAPRPDPYAALQYGLAVSGVRDARGLGAGAGVRVALLDSAPETGHGDLDATRIVGLDAAEKPPVGVHGTLMTGVIAAIEDNGFGIAGLAPRAEIVSIPVCRPRESGGECTVFDLLRGFDRAFESESAIVNLALSGPPNALLERGVARLEELGLVLVAAAGNEGSDVRRYPAAYPSVVGVGALDRAGRPFAAGNHGPWVELWAPGVEILSTVPGNAFAFGDGTSLAAAHVTGVLAVLTSVTKDAKQARGALFRAAQAGHRAPPTVVPPVCEVLARLGAVCEPPRRPAAEPPRR